MALTVCRYTARHRFLTMQRMPASRYVIFTLLAVGGLIADLWTKHAMFAWSALRPHGAVWWYVPGYAGFQNSLNEGAMFGLGQGQQVLFGIFSVAAGIAIPVWLFYFGAGRDWWLTIPLGGVMAGVFGNLYDRLGLHGMAWGVDWPLVGQHTQGEPIHAVRDWILFQANDALRWPNFNLADVLLVVGAAILFLQASRTPSAPANAARTAETSPSASASQESASEA